MNKNRKKDPAAVAGDKLAKNEERTDNPEEHAALPPLHQREELAQGIEIRARERGVWKRVKRWTKDLVTSDPKLVRRAIFELVKVLMKWAADADFPDDEV